MAVHSSQSRFKTGIPSLRVNNARSAMLLTHTCTTTTAKHDHNSVVRSAHQILTSTIVIKERLKLNITAHIAAARCSAGKPRSTSSFTNVATITAPIVLMRLSNLTRRNKILENQNLPSSNFVTFTANICSKPKILLCHRL